MSGTLINPDIHRIRLRMARTVLQAAQPRAVSRVLNLLDDPDVSVLQLERAIGLDAGLTATVLCCPVSEVREKGATTLRAAIMRIGTVSLRKVAIASAIRSLAVPGSAAVLFPYGRFSRHSLGAAYFAKKLFADHFADAVSTWCADEIYAVGMIHDIGYPLLAQTVPELYGRLEVLARNNQTTIRNAFFRVFGVRLGRLTAEALESWEGAELLCNMIDRVDTDLDTAQQDPIVLCLYAANCLAMTVQKGSIEHWPLGAVAEEVSRLADILPEGLIESHLAKGALDAGGLLVA